ncbi:MAG TPA: hypothetical protein VLX56_08170 [Nitrososphaerales archaeon]|nr:hypothetical protein [Nitrososphaerales archaeon]
MNPEAVKRQGTVSLSWAQREAVLFYCRTAAASGAALILRDLVELLPLDVTEGELEEAISKDDFLASRVLVESGLVLLKQPGSDQETVQKALDEAEERRRRAIANVEAGMRFSRFFSEGMAFVAIAGTNSYLSARPDDDIDYYVVTRTDGMWAFMLKALILSRIASKTDKPAHQPFCFSFVMDERRWREEFGRQRTALSARDTLTAKVFSGYDAYLSILENAPWMRSYFPKFYDRRLAEAEANAKANRSRRRGSRVVNEFLYLTLGSYVHLRAWVMNRRLAKAGKTDAVFKTWIGPDRLEYASRRYVELGKMYQALPSR